MFSKWELGSLITQSTNCRILNFYPIKNGDTGEFSKYGENDNIATIANKAKHKAIRGPIKVGDTSKFAKYGENDNFATVPYRAWNFTNGLIYNGY